MAEYIPFSELKDFFVCEEIIRGKPGKYEFRRIYGPVVTVPNIPFIVPKLSFVVRIKTRETKLKYTVSAKDPDGNVLLREISLPEIPPLPPGDKTGFCFFHFRNVTFMKEGIYKFILKVTGQLPTETKEVIEEIIVRRKQK